MQKVLGILEQYVEFIVLGLGALFLVFMAWSYLVQTPVTIPVGAQSLRPGDIDNATVHGPVEQLEQQEASAHPPKVVVPDFTADIRKRLDTEEPAPLQVALFTAMPGDAQVRVIDKNTDILNPTQVVKSLPKIPAAEIADVNRGRTNVVMPPADWQPGTPLPVVNLQPILNPTPIAPATPGMLGRPAQPGALTNPATGRPPVVNGAAPAAPAPAPAPAAPGAPAPPVLADKDWVTVMYKLPMKAIGQAFTDANIPQGQQLNLFKTCVLDVELVRQEIVDGKPSGDEVVVKKLEVSNTPPFPNGLADEMQYVGWAANNQGQIIQPGFFQIARGDPWLPPGVVDQTALAQQQAPVNQAFDVHRKFTPEEIRQLTPQQKKMIRDAKEADARAKIRSNAGNNNSGRGAGGEVPMDENSQPEVPDLSRLQFAQVAPPQVLTPEEMADQGMDNGDNGTGNGFQQPQMAPAAYAQFPLPPQGEYDPRTAPDPTIGWATDDTVEPGKSYQYKVRYKIKNPVFQTINVAQPRNLANVFAITSPDSGWTQPVSIPPLTRFFVASLFNNKVTLQIFRWQNGELHSHSVNVAPGDLISYKDPAGIDFSTGWTLVDVTVDPGRNNRPLIVVADPAGQLHRRDADSDRDDPEYLKMKSLLPAATPVASR